MTLENLLKIGKIRKEPFDQQEHDGLYISARDRLTDSQNTSLSFSSRFDLAYSAAHGLALVALRKAGYRTDKRYLVFHCLNYTTNLSNVSVRIFARCHELRNLSEYEGYFDPDEQLLRELITQTKALLENISDNEA
jgi:hypothetical protein